MANYMVYDIGGSAIKWSIINSKAQMLVSGKINIESSKESFLNELISNVELYKKEYLL